MNRNKQKPDAPSESMSVRIAELYDDTFTRIYNSIRYRVEDAAAAEELTADVYERAIVSFDRYRPEQGPVEAWLFGIVHHVVGDYLRRRRLIAWISLEALRGQPAPDPSREEICIQNSLEEKLLQVLPKLKDSVAFIGQFCLLIIGTLALAWVIKSLRPGSIAATQLSGRSATATVSPSVQGTATGEPFTYIVKPGDTLDKIAAEVGMPAERLTELNSLKSGEADLFPGQKLILGYHQESPPQPSDTIQASPQALRLDSPHETIRQRILQPEWKSLWIQAEIRQVNNGGGVQELVTYTQAYLAQDGRGRVLTSDPIPGFFAFTVDVAVNIVAISDGQDQVRYDMKTKQEDPSAVPNHWTQQPLESVNQITQMLFPTELALHSQDIQPLREAVIADRRALVVDWAEDRLWVDEETGLILRREHYPSSDRQQAPLYQAQINQLVLGIDLLDAVLHPAYLDELAFEAHPVLTEPVVSSTSAGESKSGWIYLEIAGEAPYQWQVIRLPAGCLTELQTCPDPLFLPGHPNVQISNLAWSPDGSLAAFSDTNHNKLIVYDPSTRQWQRALNIFLQYQLDWSPDGNKIAGVGANDTGENNRLVVIDRSGWVEHTVDAGLEGELFVYGWLDNDRLLVGGRLWPVNSAGTSSGLLAGLYQVDVNNGQSQLLVPGATEGALSPDGSKLIAVLPKGASNELLIANADGSDLHSLNVEGSMPSWSPDGQWIVFSDSNNLSMIRPDGSEVRKNVVFSPLFPLVWSPDGSYFLAQAGDDLKANRSWLAKVSVKDGRTQLIPMKMFDNEQNWQLLSWSLK
jgi:hypothetical protein